MRRVYFAYKFARWLNRLAFRMRWYLGNIWMEKLQPNIKNGYDNKAVEPYITEGMINDLVACALVYDMVSKKWVKRSKDKFPE
jgi:hypothetical protein